VLEIPLVILDETDTKLGGVETYREARKCAELFRSHRDRIAGVLVVLPNFGDEKGVADTLKLADLDVPVLIQAYPDDLDKMDPARRRDAFCGKVSVCNNLRQYGIPFSLTERHTIRLNSRGFRAELERFLAVCRVVRGLRTARLGAVGARPAGFNTVRYSEKILQAHGISVTTLDLSELFGWANRLDDDDLRAAERLREIRAYAKTDGVPGEKLSLLAAWTWSCRTGSRKTTSMRRLSSAGLRSRRTTASTLARS